MINKKILFSAVFLANILFVCQITFGQKVKIKKAVASSLEGNQYKFAPGGAVDGNLETRWASDRSDLEWILFELNKKTVIDKVVIQWESAYGKNYQIQVSENGKDWYVVYNAVKHEGGKETVNFKPVNAKFVRMLGISRGTGWGYSIWEFEIYASDKDPVSLTGFAKPEEITYPKSDITPGAYYYFSSAKSPPGYYPMWLGKKQEYWTMTGVPVSRHETLFSEYGTIDPYKEGFVLMPYLYTDDKLITAQNADKVVQGLEEGYLPIPSVTWQYENLSFVQKVFTYGSEKESKTGIIYTLENNGDDTVRGKLFLTIRPFQINPPWMFGGFTEVSQIEKNGNIISINGKPRILDLNTNTEFGAMEYKDGEVIDTIKNGCIPEKLSVSDTDKSASGVFAYTFELPKSYKEKYFFVVQLGEKSEITDKISSEEVISELEKVKKSWRKNLNKVEINIPDKELLEIFKTNLAYIMLNYDDSAFIPGPRNYERSWTRDGSAMAAAVLKCGHPDMVKRYIQWLVSYQRPSGEIPPILDTDGNPKGEREYDNQGEFLFTAAEYYRFTGDKKFIDEIFPALVKAAGFIKTLRNRRLTEEYKNTRFYGILPTSISHEGFPDPGAHSYFDVWFALKGLKDLQYLASELGRKKEVKWVNRLEEELRESLLGSIRLTMEEKNIRFIPSSAEGHQDACGNSISIWPTEEEKYLPDGLIKAHVDDWYFKVFLPERKKRIKHNFISYEIRYITACLIKEDKKKALDMLNFFKTTVRPGKWKVWGEGVSSDYRAPVYLGDMPHTWTSAIYINTLRTAFVYENEKKLVLGLGIDENWLSDNNVVSVKDMPTYFGDISYSMKMGSKSLMINVQGNAKPEKEFVLKSPFLKKKIKGVKINGERWKNFLDKEVVFKKLPSEIEVYYE